VQRDVLVGLDNDPEPPRYLQELVEQECLGYKTGKGFYDWQVKDMQELAARRDRFIIEALRTLRTTGPSSRD
jgi:3-hydroxybutyryl-CoA dehydrogenase